jgi:hypothetical protein
MAVWIFDRQQFSYQGSPEILFFENFVEIDSANLAPLRYVI